MRILGIILLAACEASSAAAPAPGDASIAKPPAQPDAGEAADPPYLVEAFGGHPPRLPLLSSDGKLAAIDVSEGVGMSSTRSYEVAIVDGNGKVRERFTVVDMALARKLLTDEHTALPKAQLAKAAARLKKRLKGFTPFSTAFDFDQLQRAHGKLALGDTTLEYSGTLDLVWIGSTGRPLTTEHVATRPRQYKDREGGRCGGEPKLTGVWWDEAHAAVVLQIIFPGHDSCTGEPALWKAWLPTH